MPCMTAEPPANADPALASLRAEIDRLDDSIHGLVMQRAAIVQRLTSSRAKGAGPAVRAKPAVRRSSSPATSR